MHIRIESIPQDERQDDVTEDFSSQVAALFRYPRSSSVDTALSFLEIEADKSEELSSAFKVCQGSGFSDEACQVEACDDPLDGVRKVWVF